MSSGIKHDQGKVPMELLSTKALIEIAKVLQFGKAKYSANNWRAGLQWSRVIGAAFRHLSAFNDGEDKDPESGLSHLAHAACCLQFLLEYEQTHKELDDRYKPTTSDLPTTYKCTHANSYTYSMGDGMIVTVCQLCFKRMDK